MSNDLADLKQWLLQQFPATIVSSDPEITVNEDELLIILHLNTDTLASEGEARSQAESTLIEHYRHETRTLRIQLGRQIYRTYGFVVSWGMRAGETLQLFTNNNTVPVMTRLSGEERRVLDTLIAANIANTRSTALSYIVRTFAAEHQDWLREVQEASMHMAQLRERVQPAGEERVGRHMHRQRRRGKQYDA
ncbi:MAG: hypothetical protein JOZ18_16900 [Chloroflexi bacterium]|nr:hypothetical protein [Chloroflexota bacterium]